MQCGAKTKSGAPCKAPAMANGRCRMHFGNVPAGAASPHFKHGRYSKVLPQRLQERHDASLDDPDLLSRRADLALIDSRLADLLARVDSGEAGRLWNELWASWQALEAKRTPENAIRHRQAIERGREDYAAWDEVLALLKTRDKIASSESKRLIDMQVLMDSNEALTMARFLVDSVRRHVRDLDAVDAISKDVGRFVRQRADERLRRLGGDE